MSEPLEATARLYEETAKELDLTARHCERSVEHFRNGAIPRGTAHAWAARGHLLEAESHLDEQAREHADKSSV